MQNIKQKAIKGVSWSFIESIANYGITFLVGVVLARLLTPEEFGLVGMVAIFVALSNTIVDSGFSSALIRKVNVKPVDYSTTFYFNMVLSVFLYVLLYLAAPSIGNFFNEPLLVDITRAIGVVLIINALGIVQRTILVKEVNFKKQTKISFVASLISGIVGIVMAMNEFGVWSLVIMQIMRQFINTMLLWLFNSWRPLLEFSKNSFKELFGFGSKLLASGVIDTLYNNVYYVVIGKFYTANQLGQYTRAKQFSTLVSGNITAVVQRVSYPVLSNIQGTEDGEKLKNAYQRIIKSTMLVTFTCVLGLAAVAKPLIVLLIGAKWIPSVVYLQILCFGAMLYPLHAINLNMLNVKGRSDLFLKLEILKKIIGVGPIVLGIYFGIELMLVGGVLSSFIAFFLNSKYSGKLINYSTKSQIKDVFPAFLIAFSTALLMWSITIVNLGTVITLVIQCLVGVILSIAMHEFIKLSEYVELKHIILSVIKKKN